MSNSSTISEKKKLLFDDINKHKNRYGKNYDNPWGIRIERTS